MVVRFFATARCRDKKYSLNCRVAAKRRDKCFYLIVFNPALGIVLAGLWEAVQEGQPLSAALAGHPGLFSPIFINMVRAGEASSTLPLVLTQLADFGEREQGLQSRIRAALLYPLFLALSGAAMLVLLLTVVLPKITAVFAESEQALL